MKTFIIPAAQGLSPDLLKGLPRRQQNSLRALAAHQGSMEFLTIGQLESLIDFLAGSSSPALDHFKNYPLNECRDLNQASSMASAAVA